MQSRIIGQIIAILIHAHNLLHHRRFDKRQKIEIHRPKFILKRHLLNIFFFPSRRQSNHMYFLFIQNLSEAIQAQPAVVIAADEHHLSLRHSPFQFRYKAVKHFHCLCRNGLVVDIPGNHDGIRLFFSG